MSAGYFLFLLALGFIQAYHYVLTLSYITKQKGTIISPNYPQNYPNEVDLDYHIYAGQHDIVTIYIVDFALETCCDFLLYGTNSSSILQKMVVPNTPFTITILGPAHLKFITDHSITMRGFKVIFSVDSFSSAQISELQSFSSPDIVTPLSTLVETMSIMSLPIPSPSPSPTWPYGCYSYSYLSEYYRHVGSQNYYYCDNNLKGWYRFSDSAGTKMLDICPSRLGKRGCSSHYSGWLLGSHPRYDEGMVAKTVCFSAMDSCVCDFSTTIYVKNCGSHYVYWLNHVPSCNLMYCGMRDILDVSCKRETLVINIEKDYYRDRKYLFTFRNVTCKHDYSSGTLTTKLGGCGTQREDLGNRIIYKNTVILHVLLTNTSIVTLERRFSVSCSYRRKGYVKNSGYTPSAFIHSYEVGFGKFSFYLYMYKTKEYKQRYLPGEYPVSTDLSQWLYFETVAITGDSNTYLFMDRCYVTPSSQKYDPNTFDLIRNMCPVPSSSTVLFSNKKSLIQRFKTKAVSFLSSERVYVHCRLFICSKNVFNSRCLTSCQNHNSFRNGTKNEQLRQRRENNEIKSTSSEYTLTQGPIILGRKEENKYIQKPFQDQLTLISLGAAVVILLTMTLALAYKITIKK